MFVLKIHPFAHLYYRKKENQYNYVLTRWQLCGLMYILSRVLYSGMFEDI